MSKTKIPALTDAEIQSVSKEILGGEPPLWIRWVVKRKLEKEQARLIVVGKYRIFSLKKTLTGKKKIVRVGHLFDLKEINSSDIDRVDLKFTTFNIDVECSEAGTTMLRIIREAIQRIAYSWNEYAQPRISLFPIERQLPAYPGIDPGPGNGFLETYLAFCDYYKSPPHQDFVRFLRTVFDKGSRELDLDQFPALARKVDPLAWPPVKASLRYDTWFNSFVMRNVPRRDICLSLAEIFQTNRTIRKVVCSRVGGNDECFVALGAALKQNAQNVLEELDISSNSVHDKGITALAEGFETFQHKLVLLDVSECGIGPKGLQNLFHHLLLGKAASDGLEELNISTNTLGAQMSVHMAQTITQLGSSQRLSRLYLSGTKADVGVISKALKASNVQTLTEVDFSDNKIDKEQAPHVAALLSSLGGLKAVNLCNCGLNKTTGTEVLSAIAKNTALSNLQLFVNNNDMGIDGAKAVARLLSDTSILNYLMARQCHFKKVGMTAIGEALAKNNSLQVLDISFNIKSGSVAKMTKLMTLYGESIRAHPRLEALVMAGDEGKFAIGREIEFFVKQVAEGNARLAELDVRGNKIGDQAAASAFDGLRKNTNLKSLLWDRNDISLSGWQSLVNILAENKTICHCPHPYQDIQKTLKSAKDKDYTKQKVRELLDSIEKGLKKNLPADSSGFVSVVRKPKAYARSAGIAIAAESVPSQENSQNPNQQYIPDQYAPEQVNVDYLPPSISVQQLAISVMAKPGPAPLPRDGGAPQSRPQSMMVPGPAPLPRDDLSTTQSRVQSMRIAPAPLPRDPIPMDIPEAPPLPDNFNLPKAPKPPPEEGQELTETYEEEVEVQSPSIPRPETPPGDSFLQQYSNREIGDTADTSGTPSKEEDIPPPPAEESIPPPPPAEE